MSSNVKELIAKYNAEEVCGRLVALVNGKREYIANYDEKGFSLTEIGLQLEEGLIDFGPLPPTDAPAKPKRERKVAVKAEETPVPDNGVSDLLAGLDA